MGYRKFDDNTSWEQCRKDTRTTKTVLEASEVHEVLATPLKTSLQKWDAIEVTRVKDDNDIVDANDRVTVYNVQCTNKQQLTIYSIDLIQTVLNTRLLRSPYEHNFRL